MSGRDVGELWAQLKAQQAPSGARRGPGLSGLGGLPGVTSHVRTYDKNRGPEQRAQRPSFIQQLGQAQKGQEPQQGGTSDHQALLASLQRDINGLSDPDRSTRRRAVEKLHAALLGPGSTVAPEALQAQLCGPLLVPLVRLLADPAEKCRELAVGLLAAALPRLPAPAALLPTLLPALAQRVGSSPPEEESEEMRLALAELLAGPLLGTLCQAVASHSAGAAAAAAAAAPSQLLPADLLLPLCATLCCQLADPYADIKKAACTSIAHLAALLGPRPDALPPPLLQPLVASLAADLAHQHSRVRLAALQALHPLMARGMPVAVMQDIVLPAVRALAHDHSPAIRATLYRCAAQWAGSQLAAGGGGDDDGREANQCRTFLPLLLPLLLLGLTDEAEAVRQDTYAQLDAIGEGLAKQSGSPSAGAAEGMALDQPQQQALPGYCHPFSGGRPSLATRWLVQQQLTRLLQQSLAELREWTATLRASAARLLRACLVYGEEEAVPLLPSIVLGLRGAVADDNAGVATHAVGCVHVLGVNLPPRNWAPLATEAVAQEPQSVAQRTAALVVLSALLYAASHTRAEVDAASLQLCAATLSNGALVAAALAPEGGPLRQQLLAACSNLVRWAGPGVSAAGPHLFQLLLQLWAAAEADQQAGSAVPTSAVSSGAAAPLTAAAVLAQLAGAMGRASASDLCTEYGQPLLRRCVQSHEQWTQAHPDWRTASALLRLSAGDALLQLWPAALPALQLIAADHEREPRLRLDALHLLTALLEDDSKADAWAQGAMGQQLVTSLLVPALVWHAGRVAAAARYAALTALATLLARQRLPAAQMAAVACGGSEGQATGAGAAGGEQAVAGTAGGGGGAGKSKCIGLLGRVAGCLDEEYEPDVRQLACHVTALLLAYVGPQLPAAQLAALRPDLLARLDDSTNRVRLGACAALSAWLAAQMALPGAAAVVAGGTSAAAAADLSDAETSSLVSSLLLHLDDPDADVAQAVGAVLLQLAAARPGATRPLVQAAVVHHAHSRELLDGMLAVCGAA